MLRPLRRTPHLVGWIGACAMLVGAVACDRLPVDPCQTLEKIRGGVLRVGATDSPPWLVRTGDEASGPEAELVQAFAGQLGAAVRWQWGPADTHLAALERFELHLVAAGLSESSPWVERVAFTRPWHEDGEGRRVLAVPPGENRTLLLLERLIEARRGGVR